MKIINFGSCNIDYVYTVDHIVYPGETITSDELEIFPGGKGLNQSVAIAKAGGMVYHVGCIGRNGEMLKNVLIENGVDVSFLKTKECQNGHAIIQLSKSSENSIFLYKGSNYMLTKDFIDEVIDKFTSEDFVVLQNEVNNLKYIIESAYKKGMKIVLNPSPFNDELKEIDFNMISFLILNEIEIECMSGKSSPEESVTRLKEMYPNLKIVLTLGKDGCIYSDRNETLHHPSYRVEVVDTTAAGDTFTGYFITAVSEGKAYKDAIKIASIASAVAVSKKGAAISIPDKNTVLKKLNCLKPNKDKM